MSNTLLRPSVLLFLVLPTAVQSAQAPVQIEEIIVTTAVSSSDTSVISQDAESLLSIAGDISDPLKALQSLPGITFAGNDLDPPVIRGSGPDDNLYVIDGMPVTYLFHALSDSIISPNVIRTFNLHTAAAPSEFADHSGGVIDIGLRDPNSERQRRQVDIGQLKSGFLYETPLTEDVAAYVSYRHNLAHLFLEDFETGNDLTVFEMPQSRDYTARVIWRGDKSDFTLTALGAWDETTDRARDPAQSSLLDETETRRFDGQSLRYRNKLAEQTHLQGTLSYSRVEEDKREANGYFRRFANTAMDLRLKATHVMSDHALSLGANISLVSADLSFQGNIQLCDLLERQCGTSVANAPVSIEDDFDRYEVFLSDRVSLSQSVQADIGVNINRSAYLDETVVEPRARLAYQPKGGALWYARLGLHHAMPAMESLLALNTTGRAQAFERSWQGVIGQYRQLDTGWRFQTEAWYKTLSQTDFIATAIETEFSGHAYGLDVLLAKPMGENWYGWLSASLGDGELEDEQAAITANTPFLPSLSTTLAINYQWGDGWRAGFKYRYQSGDRFTPIERLVFNEDSDLSALQFTPPFSGQLAGYQRLDFRIEKQASYDYFDALYYVDMLNVLDRENKGNRTFPLRNIRLPEAGNAGAFIFADDEEGIPFFIALGVNLSF